MAILLALLSSLGLGISDFLGGVLSKRDSAWVVAPAGHLVAAAVTALGALVVTGDPRLVDLAWGLAAGIGEGVGISFLFRGLAGGQMSVVAPISGTGAALVPVIVGVATGDRLTVVSWVGIALAFPAVILIPRAAPSRSPGAAGGSTTTSGARHGVIAGLGFGAQLALVGQIGTRSGLLPLTFLWLGSATTVLALAAGSHQPWRARPSRPSGITVLGILSAAALACYLLATRDGLLAIVSVIASLYPASTVTMAALVLREPIARLQAAGIALAAAAVIMTAIG